MTGISELLSTALNLLSAIIKMWNFLIENPVFKIFMTKIVHFQNCVKYFTQKHGIGHKFTRTYHWHLLQLIAKVEFIFCVSFLAC